ncbi:MAG: GIY-YIG nuclease family protein [Lentisphaeria bacterium]|nr:GIY-YIG nuclease family protein [Lentisphaeria bacterium]
MSNFHYVYILVDEATGTHFYIGCTEDLKSRLEKHNKGDVPHTSKYKPWRIDHLNMRNRLPIGSSHSG